MTTGLDTLLASIRRGALTSGPLRVDGSLYADGTGTARPLTCMMAPASETIQQLQGQGMIEGRRATLMLNADEVATAISRDLHRGDTWVISSGAYAGTWVVQSGNEVRGGWSRADIKLERMYNQTGAEEVRT